MHWSAAVYHYLAIGSCAVFDVLRLVQVNMRPINDMEDELKQRRQYTRNTSNEAYDSDSEEEGGGRGGQRVQCAQQ